jgi:hypothetical protein
MKISHVFFDLMHNIAVNETVQLAKEGVKNDQASHSLVSPNSMPLILEQYVLTQDLMMVPSKKQIFQT